MIVFVKKFQRRRCEIDHRNWELLHKNDHNSVTCRTLRLQIADVKNDITGMEKVWKDMDEDYMYTKNITMRVLDRLDFQFEDVKRAVEDLKREAERIKRFLKSRSKN
ncbi:unnamed protein product [Heligmosomoides polygyrus]|uniref:Biogenesis of lysosome-related organelles complex 1 subunit CNL1 n=1 Tax=Heligmosomoides polygyrus TaxID=6339 RepID=A0A3P8BWU4_HELPZ|nr:unnamed protein product [Heligmosomoides polygyrus]